MRLPVEDERQSHSPETSNVSTPEETATWTWPGMQELSQDHGGPPLGSNDLHLRTPEQAESQMLFEQTRILTRYPIDAHTAPRV